MILILLEDGVPTPSWDTQETTSSRRCNIHVFFFAVFHECFWQGKRQMLFSVQQLESINMADSILGKSSILRCGIQCISCNRQQPSGWWFGLFFNLSIRFQLSRDDFSSWIGKAQVTSSIKRPSDQVEAIPEAPEISFSGALCLGEGVPFGDPGRCGYDVLASGFMNLGFACPIWIIHRSVDVSSIDSNIFGFWVWDKFIMWVWTFAGRIKYSYHVHDNIIYIELYRDDIKVCSKMIGHTLGTHPKSVTHTPSLSNTVWNDTFISPLQIVWKIIMGLWESTSLYPQQCVCYILYLFISYSYNIILYNVI